MNGGREWEGDQGDQGETNGEARDANGKRKWERDENKTKKL